MSKTNLKKYNILFILTDDQGEWALGCSGNKEIITPNLDNMAKGGVRMENFFCISPVCSPARASILTGRIPSQHGVHDWIWGGSGKYDKLQWGGTGEIEYLQGQEAYTDILARNGYTCGMVGKWHLGHSDLPQKSFSHWYVFYAGASSYFNAQMVRWKDGKLIEETTNGYLTDVITEDAIGFIEEHGKDDNPFCLHVHYNAPHRPWKNNHPAEMIELYRDCPFETLPQEPKHLYGF